MTPRSHHTNILFTLVAILSLLAPTGRLAAAEKRRPNILFILVDDQSPFDFRFYDPRSTLDSPNLSRLAAGGMVIDAAYHMGAFTGAVCTPSRHMIMSGRTVWRLPIGPGAASCPPELEKNTISGSGGRIYPSSLPDCAPPPTGPISARRGAGRASPGQDNLAAQHLRRGYFQTTE